MTEFTKTKIHFALALLAALFALHPFLDRIGDWGFLYLGYELRVFHAYLLIAGLLALCVYCFGLTLISERSHSWLERLGNYAYALAVIVLPLYGGLYLASLLADQLGNFHLAWAAPSVALGCGIGWLVLSQLLAWMLRGRLATQDRTAKVKELMEEEILRVNRAQELFAGQYYDLSTIEMWKAVLARLRAGLLRRGIAPRRLTPEVLVRVSSRHGLLNEVSVARFRELREAWNIAMGSEPLSREAATKALEAGHQLLATVPQHAQPADDSSTKRSQAAADVSVKRLAGGPAATAGGLPTDRKLVT
jgi:hypothetical protein